MGYRVAEVCFWRRVTSWISPMQAQVMAKAITASAAGSRARLAPRSGTTGPKAGPVEQRRHGEFADDDGEGQERAREHATITLGRITRAMTASQPAPRLCAASVSVAMSIVRRPVLMARYM